MTLENIISKTKKSLKTAIGLGIVGLATLVLGVAAEAGTYSGGTGEPNNPYLISTADDMNKIGANPDDWDKHFKMTSDIDLSCYTGDEFNIIGFDWNHAFSGVFDGNNHSISNFTYIDPNAERVGLFGFVGHEGALIKDLILVDPNVYGSSQVGALVGDLEASIIGCSVEGGQVKARGIVGGLSGTSGTVVDSHANTTVLGGSMVGGLLGVNSSRQIYNSYATGHVKGDGQVGGLVGDTSIGDSGGNLISFCYATGTVDGNDYTGGLVGRNTNIVMNCYATGDVSGKDNVGGLIGLNGSHPIISSFASGNVSGVSRVGGLVGINKHSISDSYAAGDVFGDTDVGGLIGLCSNYRAHIISHCYSISRVDGNGNTGGLVGSDWRHPYDNCFWDSDVNPDLNDVGNYGVTNGVEGKPTVEMKMEDTFTGWDFVGIWDIGENQTYPFLRIYRAGDLNHDEIVNMYDFAVIAEQWLEAK